LAQIVTLREAKGNAHIQFRRRVVVGENAPEILKEKKGI